jgi:hypothetical protein
MREHSPGAASLGHVEEGIEYLASVVLGWASSYGAFATTFRRRYEMLNLGPFFVLEDERGELSGMVCVLFVLPYL